MDFKPVDRVRLQLRAGRREGFYNVCKPALSAVFGMKDHFHRCGFEIHKVRLNKV